jgi:hypothetical protein
LGFGGGGVSKLTAHTHNAGLAGDGGDLSETLTDMNGVALYSLITDNTAAVAANTAAIAAINSVPGGLVGIWTASIASIPAGWVFYQDIDSTFSQLVNNSAEALGSPRTELGQQFNAGQILVGKNPSKVTWYLEKSGSPTGTVNAYITDSSGSIRETSTTLIDSSTIPTSPTATEFIFAGTTTLVAGDMITVRYTTGSAVNEVLVYSDSTTALANSIWRQYSGGSWSNFTGESGTFIVDWDFAYIKKT